VRRAGGRRADRGAFATTAPGNQIVLTTVVADVRAIENVGRPPVVLGFTSGELAPPGSGVVQLAMAQGTSIDDREIFGTPRNTTLSGSRSTAGLVTRKG